MTPLVIRYPLDPTGISPNNLVLNEQHNLPDRTVRAVATVYGAFFTESLVIRDKTTGNTLVKGEQYYPAEMYELPTARYGKEICAVIIITDTTVSNNIEIDYQCLGGEYGTSATAIIQQIEALCLDDRPVAWGAVIGRPDEYPPTYHLHDVGDVYGFEYVVHALDRIRAAIELGDAASHDAIYSYIDKIEGILDDRIRANDDTLKSHVNDFNNPHKVTPTQLGVYTTAEVNNKLGDLTTSLSNAINAHSSRTDNPHSVSKTQVGLSLVQNYSIASVAEAQAGTSNTSYVTPSLVKAYADQHSVRVDNPHQVTKGQLGLGSVENYGIASTGEAQTGVANNKYVTPALVKSYADQHAVRVDNPHATTQAQVGLGSVQNYGVATTLEAQAGTATNKYMTPALTKSAIDVHGLRTDNPHATTAAQVGAYSKAESDLLLDGVNDELDLHKLDINNPHGTTKAQVGLSLVQNYSVATTAEAQAGTATNSYMTPALVKSYADQHAVRTDNPHGTTAAQVGLGSVVNYSVATNAEALAGLVTNKYMTPALVKSYADQHSVRTDNPHNTTAAQVGAYTTTQVDSLVSGQGSALANHIADKTNPHATTKAQVGLGSVENYTIASIGEAQQGILNNRYMTPALVKAYGEQHSNRSDNPHGTTAAQVGAYSRAEIDALLASKQDAKPGTGSSGSDYLIGTPPYVSNSEIWLYHPSWDSQVPFAGVVNQATYGYNPVSFTLLGETSDGRIVLPGLEAPVDLLEVTFANGVIRKFQHEHWKRRGNTAEWDGLAHGGS